MKSVSPEAADEWMFPNRATPVGSAAYYAVRFSPAPMRQRNALLLAWYELIQDIAEHPHDPGAARLKLDWWRQEIDRLIHGKARHPLAIKLQEVGVGDRARIQLGAIIDSADDHIRSPLLNDDREFAAACRTSLGNFFVLLTHVERRSDYDTEKCVELGGYCAAVERVRRLAACEHRVPVDMNAQAFRQVTPELRATRVEALLNQFDTTPVSSGGQVPDLARRLTALAHAMHSKIRNKDYAVADAPIDRAPIAKLWTAWRCR